MIQRRQLIRGAAGLAAGGLAAGTGVSAMQAQSGPPAAGTPPHNPAQFFQNPQFNFTFLLMFGAAYERLTDVGAALAIAARITDGDSASAFRALTEAGERLAGIADAALAAGHRVSAREAYLEASNYVSAATDFIDGAGIPEQFAPTWLRHQALWDAGAALLDPPMEKIRIPYEGTTIPGYFYRVDDSGRRRPLIVHTNGSDGGAPTGVWSLGAAAALRRGYNVLTYYGPGQGLALLEQQLYFRPDWEKVVTPVLDYALTRPEVDPDRIALLGISQGGYWAPRAVAFEHRIAACVADPGVMDVATSWMRFLPPELTELLDSGDKAEFDQAIDEGFKQEPALAADLAFRSRPYGLSSYFDVFTAVRQYNLRGVTGQIRCPVLITEPEGEQFWPGQSRQLYDALTSPKTLVTFTAAEGADLHCEPKAPGLRAQRILDWLDDTLR